MKFLKRVKENKFVQALLIVVPFVLGFMGYWKYYCTEGKPLTGVFGAALYSTVRLFAFSFDAARDPAVSNVTWYYVFLEIARFWAIGVTGTALYRILRPYFVDLVTRFEAGRKNCIALHGSASVTAILKNSMDSYKVLEQNPSDERFKAGQHIVAFDSDEENLDFLRENRNALLAPRKKAPVIYLCLQSPGLGLAADSNVRVSCMAENCARMFWEKYYLKRFGKGCAQNEEQLPKRRSKIIIIGFGGYGQEILKQALLVNVFLKDSPGVEYHVFGEGEEFLRRYPMISKIAASDETDAFSADFLAFYDSKDDASLSEIYKDADRIILANDGDMENYKAFSALCSRFIQLPHIYIRLKNHSMMDSLYGGGNRAKPGDALYGVNYTVFGTDEELYTKEIIIGEALLKNAKQIHSWYAARYSNTSPWESLGAVKRGSNIAAADHFSVKLRQFLKKDCILDSQSHSDYKRKFDAVGGDPAYMSAYLEMEHTRWSRFYYLLGWDYADEKDEGNRKHNCLKEFTKLDEKTRELDMNSYLALRDMEPERVG